MFISKETGEVHIKIIYLGRAFSGKSENLWYIYNNMVDGEKSQYYKLEKEFNCIKWFYFKMKGLPKICQREIVLHLFTLGKPILPSGIKQLLLGADGIVFVVNDSFRKCKDCDKEIHSLYALDNVLFAANQSGIDIYKIPFVFQFNKRSYYDINEVDFTNVPDDFKNRSYFVSDTSVNEGIYETLFGLLDKIINSSFTNELSQTSFVPEMQKFIS